MKLFMTTDSVGGVWQYSVALAAELAREGVRVRLGVIGPAPSAEQRRAVAVTPGIEVARIDAPLDWLAGGGAALRAGRAAIAAAAQDWRADLVQANQPAYAGGRYPAPIIAVAHSCVETWWRGTHGASAPADWAWHREAVAEGLRQAAVAVAPSQSFAAMLAETYGLPKPPVAILNGAAPDGATPGRKGAFVLASGRAWDASKNMALLEAAAPAIRWPVRLAGECAAPEGAGAPAFRHVRCLGHLDGGTIAREYAAAPIYVSPSLHEPFGLGVLEAARAGAAPVLADIPTFRELWGGAALFFPRRDPAALAAAVNRVIEDEALRARIASAAIERAAGYTVAATARAMRAAYATALGAATPAVEAAKVPA